MSGIGRVRVLAVEATSVAAEVRPAPPPRRGDGKARREPRHNNIQNNFIPKLTSKFPRIVAMHVRAFMFVLAESAREYAPAACPSDASRRGSGPGGVGTEPRAAAANGALDIRRDRQRSLPVEPAWDAGGRVTLRQGRRHRRRRARRRAERARGRRRRRAAASRRQRGRRRGRDLAGARGVRAVDERHRRRRRGGARGQGRRSARRRRRDRRHRRRIGLRQVDGGALHRPADRADRRPHPPRGPRPGDPLHPRAAPAPPPRPDRFPGPLPLVEPAPQDRRVADRGAGQLPRGRGRGG